MRRAWGVVGLLVVLGPMSAGAQLRPLGSRGGIGIAGVLARPVGEFRQFVDWGGGLGMYGLVPIDRGGHLALRVDGTAVIYGHERYATPFSSTVRRVWVDVSTDNYIVGLALGPQLTLGSGAVRPYAFGTAGVSYFATESSVSGSDSDYRFASTTNFSDATFALSGGGGVRVVLSEGRRPVALDLSAQSTHNGEAEYLRRGGIIENADGSLTLLPIRSETNLVTFRAGVFIGL